MKLQTFGLNFSIAKRSYRALKFYLVKSVICMLAYSASELHIFLTLKKWKQKTDNYFYIPFPDWEMLVLTPVTGKWRWEIRFAIEC